MALRDLPCDTEAFPEAMSVAETFDMYPEVDDVEGEERARTDSVSTSQLENGTSGVKRDVPRGIWPPSHVVKPDRGKATTVWGLLFSLFISYVVFLGMDSSDKRNHPPVQITRKEEAFRLPDVVLCPATGDGCDSENSADCSLGLQWRLSALGGFLEEDKYLATPSPVIPPTPSPTPIPTPAPTPGRTAPTLGALPAPPGFSSGDDVVTSSLVLPDAITTPPTPSPVVLPAIRVTVETMAHEWCPRLPLSNYTINQDGIDSGDVRSLHASFYVLWNDQVAEEPVLSTRQFINMFFVDDKVSLEEAVVAGKLSYGRVNITGTEPFTFPSNDVIIGLSQYVHLASNGQEQYAEKTYTQTTTTAEHTIRLKAFEGQTYEGALLYVTFNVNSFAYQSVEEVDPVDWWGLVGSAGGMWEIVCVIFGVCFVAGQVSEPDKKWGWGKEKLPAIRAPRVPAQVQQKLGCCKRLKVPVWAEPVVGWCNQQEVPVCMQKTADWIKRCETPAWVKKVVDWCKRPKRPGRVQHASTWQLRPPTELGPPIREGDTTSRPFS